MHRPPLAAGMDSESLKEKRNLGDPDLTEGQRSAGKQTTANDQTISEKRVQPSGRRSITSPDYRTLTEYFLRKMHLTQSVRNLLTPGRTKVSTLDPPADCSSRVNRVDSWSPFSAHRPFKGYCSLGEERRERKLHDYGAYFRSSPSELSFSFSGLLNRAEKHYSGHSFPLSFSSVTEDCCFLSVGRPQVIQDSTREAAYRLLPVESESGCGFLPEVDASVALAPPEPCLPPPPGRIGPPLSPVTSTEVAGLRQADALFRSSFEEFTPDITADEDGETFRLRCPRPGLYLCSVTGLVFHVGGDGGEVVYRVVPWDQRLLARHHKKAAGPLFDIRCEQRSVLGLQLPHCEILSGGGGDFLSVAHLEDDAEAFLRPKEVTETHVLVDVSGLSAYGNVKDEDSPPQPVRALVLLFYRAPDDPDDPESLLNVLMLPGNVVLREVQRIRKKLVGPERYIETPSHCKLHPDRDYVLSTSPQDDRILVEPTEAEFYCDNYDNYVPFFQVTLETRLNHIKLLLKEGDGSLCVWERRAPLIVRASSGPSAPDLANSKRLLAVRTGFIEGISGPVLKSLLDRLLEKKVITDAEGEAAEATPNHRDRARFVIDIVRKKGEDASLEMIEFLRDDPFLCEHLGLM